jgi:uncharacterized repeat protein (TIGR03803 family)
MPKPRKRFVLVPAFTVVFGFLTVAVPLLAAGSEKVLHSFASDRTDGYRPNAGLIFDASGSLYGTTYGGGDHGYGTVFQLTLGKNGKWTKKVLHSFGKGVDGQTPLASLIFDTSGNLYGTTSAGGRYNVGCDYGCGTVFELTPGSNGKWMEKVLHNFGKGVDGWSPLAGLTFDTAGNLYGTTYHGGPSNEGIVFQLKPNANSTWIENVLLNFNGKNGAYPAAGLISDANGSLYGTTAGGGPCSCGTVFELTPTKNGRWAEKILFRFTGGNDGVSPNASLIFDATGNLYGTTTFGGLDSEGTVFELTPGSNGKWVEKLLHSFTNNGHGGYNPYAALILDTAGCLYGTTYWGGDRGNNGTVFRLAPSRGGRWTEKVLHNFRGGSDGQLPWAGLVFDRVGNLFGTTYGGGAHSGGTVFEITP